MFNLNNMNNQLLIVANGRFPSHYIPLNILKKSKFIIACDGAVNQLNQRGYTPDLIIGDMDSISDEFKKKYKRKLIYRSNQNDNDLRKAINYCQINKLYNINIIGATGNREDHTLGNIFSINNLNFNFNIKLFTDSGCFTNINKPTLIHSFSKQQVSLFSENKNIKIKTYGLKYNYNNNTISSLFYGTLNESVHNKFFINITNNSLLILLKYP